jgi:type I restriction-modification system DNA methylase subunit
MEQGQLNWVANFIWGIADDVLRDLYVRGKYRDVILPMTVLRRLDAVLESSKQAVLDMKASLDKAGITNQDQALRQAAGQAFYNTSKFTLRDLKARASQQQLKNLGRKNCELADEHVLLREGRDHPSGRERHADDCPRHHFQAPSARLTATI